MILRHGNHIPATYVESDMKTRPLLLSLTLTLALVLASCGTETGALGDGDPDLATPDSTVGAPSDGDAPIAWTRIEARYDLIGSHVSYVQEIVVDPTDDTVVLVRFFGGVAECYGANATVITHTADEILVALETGLIPTDDESRFCIEMAVAQEIALQLDAPAGDATVRAVDAEAPFSYPGLSKDDAIAKAESENRAWRISSEDGEHFALTMDYRPDRINFDIEAGVVTNAWMG